MSKLQMLFTVVFRKAKIKISLLVWVGIGEITIKCKYLASKGVKNQVFAEKMYK